MLKIKKRFFMKNSLHNVADNVCTHAPEGTNEKFINLDIGRLKESIDFIKSRKPMSKPIDNPLKLLPNPFFLQNSIGYLTNEGLSISSDLHEEIVRTSSSQELEKVVERIKFIDVRGDPSVVPWSREPEMMECKDSDVSDLIVRRAEMRGGLMQCKRL